MAPQKSKRKARGGQVAKTSASVPSDELDDVRLISARQVRALLGNISEMQLWRMINNSALEFPRPIKLADMVSAGKKPRIASTRNFFRFAEIKAWIAKRQALSVERAAR